MTDDVFVVKTGLKIPFHMVSIFQIFDFRFFSMPSELKYVARRIFDQKICDSIKNNFESLFRNSEK